MSWPEKEEVLFTYVAVASHVVSLILIRVDNGVQMPVYYVSKSLHEVEVRYLSLENEFWQWCMLRISSLTTSNPTRLLF